MKRMLINAYGIGKQFDEQYVLNDFWMEITQGTVIGLCGMNQSGKTLAAQILAGDNVADTGKFYIENIFFHDLQEASEKLRHITKYLGRKTVLFDELSIADNYWLLCNRPMLGVIHNRDLKEIDGELKALNFQAEPDQMLSDLPFGWREYCEILLMMLSGKKLLILDEKLDAIYRWNPEVGRRLLKIGKKRNIAFVLISNHLDMLQVLCDEISVIRNGYSIMQVKRQEYDRKKLIRLMTGEDDRRSLFPRGVPAEKKKKFENNQEIVFEAKEFRLEKEDPELSFVVHKSEIAGILSLNNQWNQLFAETLAGRWEHFFGSLYLGGVLLTAGNLWTMRSKKHKICVLPMIGWKELLFSDMSMEDNLMLPSMQKMYSNFIYIGKKMSRFARGHLVESEMIKAEDVGKVNVKELDSLTAMRLVMERIRIYNPAVLVIAGLTESADVRMREAIYQECKKCAEHGIGILLISSDINEMLALCDKVILVKERHKTQEICVNGTEKIGDLSFEL